MATSRAFGTRLLRCLESKKNLAGSACGILGLGLTVTGAAGAYWPLVVAGLYGVGALVAPPEPPEPPRPQGPTEQLGGVRERFGRLREYVAEVELPDPAAGRLAELMDLYGALLEPGWVADVLAADPESVHTLSRAIELDVPECVDTYNRTRWWTRLTPGGESPERHLERQLSLLHEEAERLTADLQDRVVRRPPSHPADRGGRG
ncbi:hypothetical protein ACFXA3_19085, partial [Streptomyces sp. NPDC059456]|uniref:hypothetical protein n=1 Tax=Streptomyces sp. NPDC059456 TaxID=3346838 RepID=UPI0036A4BF46